MRNRMIHYLADVQTSNISAHTQIWQFAAILKCAVIGEHYNINCHTLIENDVILRNRIILKMRAVFMGRYTIRRRCFIGPHVSFVNDKFPRYKQQPMSFQKMLVCKGASIGANATILGGLIIGEYAMVGAGSLVTKNVPPFSLVYGNPAKIRGDLRDVSEF